LEEFRSDLSVLNPARLPGLPDDARSLANHGQ
jgi:hypothetical protein